MLSEYILHAKDLTRWLHQVTNERSVPKTIRVITGLAIFQISMDIADAMVILLEAQLPGPAFSLGRPLFENYVRGFWILHYATDAQIEEFAKGFCPSISKMLNQIDKKLESGGAWIHENKNINIKNFHDLTHGGSEHVRRRITINGVEPNYPEQEIKRLIEQSIEIRIRIGAELLEIMGDDKALQVLRRKSLEFRSLL